jgi:putative ABC transport system permease protein
MTSGVRPARNTNIDPFSDDTFLLVRPKSGDAEALAPSIRAAISRVDKEQFVSVRSVMTLDDIARAATGRHRFRAVMVMAFAALALVLAMVGVFGILAYSVQQSVRDFGVRRALGATTHDVLRLVLTNAIRALLVFPRGFAPRTPRHPN